MPGENISWTREEWRKALESAGIRKGGKVLFQMDPSWASRTSGGMQAILEALMDTVGQSGTIVVPSFTKSCLDPACLSGLEYSKWGMVRKNLPGFDEVLSCPDPLEAVVMSRFPGTVRTVHPVYSFLFWGAVDSQWLKQPMDFPLDFASVLAIFEDKKARNVLAGLEWKDSLLYQAMAHYVGLDLVRLEKAVIHKQKRNVTKVYLMSDPLEEHEKEVMDLLEVEMDADAEIPLTILGLYSSPARTREIFSNARMESEQK